MREFIQFVTNVSYNLFNLMLDSRDIIESEKIIDAKALADVNAEIRDMMKAKKYRDVIDRCMKMSMSKEKYAIMSYAYLGLREWRNLIQCCDKGLQVDRNESEFYSLKGKSLGKLGKYHDEILQMTEAIKLNSQIPSYHRNLGSAYYGIQKYDLAIASYNKAIQLQPDNILNYHNKGSAYLKNEQFQQAKFCFQKAIQIHPNLALSYSWLGDCQKSLQNFDEAIRLLKKAYEISGKEVYQKQIEKIMKEKELHEKKGSWGYSVSWLKNKIF